MLYLVGFLVVASVVLIVYSLWPKNDDETEIIKRRMKGKRAQDSIAALREEAKESVTTKLLEKVAPIATKPTMLKDPEDVSKLRLRLAMAGFRADNATTMILASKTIVAACLGMAGLLIAWAKGATLFNMFGISMFAAGVGFMAPEVWLNMAIGKRQQAIKNGLPDALDMLVISVESGLGLDAAMQRVGDEMRLVHATLSEEFQIVTLESQMGIPRREAMDNLASRTGIDELQGIVGTVNQAERFGTSIGKALRNQSAALRTKRRQAAEEKAQKTTVKLMAPLILFIFPAILVVLAGPAALKMMEALAGTSLGSG
ncbi:MAG: type II secretion system F family protein [Planctomycetota bacterium]|jgi:tight adherence protein C